jgi:DNA ligase-4
MGFKFSFLCDLLSSLEDNQIAKVTAANKDTPDFRSIAQWFHRHERHIHHPDMDRLALLSCLFPEKRPDRVYWLQATSLARVIGRCLGLGSSRLSDMDQWRWPGGPDLGQCVENVMCQAENQIYPDREVSVEEIDQALDMIASRCRFSGPRVRLQQTAVDVESALAPLYRRLSSRDAKWLTRMILKSYSPVALPEKYTLGRFHFLLPHLLQFQNTFEGALDMLSSEPMNNFPPRPDPKLAANLCSIALDHLRPRTGIKIGRPEYFKARSIKHCHQMARGRRMSIERKYDGEYCQIHVDLTNKQTPIQIFSKSGKDSTAGRSAIIPVLKDSLRIGMAGCKFVNYCILEGELLVWSDKLSGIADFHKLRKFLPRAGTFIGIDHDSP